MKLIFLIVLLCGITSTPVYTKSNAKAKKNCVCTKTTNAEAPAINLEMLPSGLLFQF